MFSPFFAVYTDKETKKIIANTINTRLVYHITNY